MARVKILLNLGTMDYPENPLPEGEHEVTDEFAAKLIARRHAVLLPPVKATISSAKAEPPEAVETKPEPKPEPKAPATSKAKLKE
jgi:hypothetical protein